MAWYTTGTIAVSGVTVTGSNTKWMDNKQGIGSGQALLIPGSGTVKLYEIKRVDSNTQITLASDAGEVAAGQAYAIMSFYTDSVPDFARRLAAQLSYYQGQMDGWQEVMTGEGDITITAPDGREVTISSFKKLTEDMNKLTTDMNEKARTGTNDDITELTGLTTPLSIEQGGTGANKAADAREKLGMPLMTSDRDKTRGRVMQTGAFGLGSGIGISDSELTGADTGSLFFWQGGGSGSNWFSGFGAGLVAGYFPGSNIDMKLFIRGSDGVVITNVTQANTNPVTLKWNTLYGTANTVRSSDGTLRVASPVVKIFNDGRYETNSESEGVTVTWQNTGRYLVEGCMGINADAAWGGTDGGFDIPADRNRQPLLWLDYEVNADGSLLVKTYHRTHPGAPEWARNDRNGYVNGDPIDIPADQYVSVRVEMPPDSIWHQRQREMQGS